MNLPPILKSRKFWAALVALVISLFGTRAGVDVEQLVIAVSALVAYILGTALEDGLRARR